MGMAVSQKEQKISAAAASSSASSKQPVTIENLQRDKSGVVKRNLVGPQNSALVGYRTGVASTSTSSLDIDKDWDSLKATPRSKKIVKSPWSLAASSLSILPFIGRPSNISNPASPRQPVKIEGLKRGRSAAVKGRSFGRPTSITAGNMTAGNMTRYISMSMASADPEDFDCAPKKVKSRSEFTEKSPRVSIASGSSFGGIPTMMAAISISIGSADPEELDISLWNVSERVDLAAYRESSRGMFPSPSKPTLIFGVMVCSSFQEYHLQREQIIETPYEIHLEEYNENWARDGGKVCKLLVGMDMSKKYWHQVQHIGSTSIPNMVAKPIIDIMITLREEVKFKEAIDEFLREQFYIKKKLPLKIGFTGKAPYSDDDWGFFQVPRKWAKKLGIFEVNIHIFKKNCNNALEKNLFRNYLRSAEGDTLKMEYCAVKRKLMKELNGGLHVADYALRKNEIVAKILDEAHRWNRKIAKVDGPVFAISNLKGKDRSTTLPIGIEHVPKQIGPEAKV